MKIGTHVQLRYDREAAMPRIERGYVVCGVVEGEIRVRRVGSDGPQRRFSARELYELPSSRYFVDCRIERRARLEPDDRGEAHFTQRTAAARRQVIAQLRLVQAKLPQRPSRTQVLDELARLQTLLSTVHAELRFWEPK